MRVYQIPIDCGLLGVLDADIHIIGRSLTHVYLRVGSGVMVDVVHKLSPRVMISIREACENA